MLLDDPCPTMLPLALLLPLTLSAPQATALPRTEDESFARVAPTVELALVLAALSPLGEDDPDYEPVHRRGDHFDALLEHFGAHRDHPAVRELGASYSLPRLVGNAADFRFDDEGRLVEVVSDGSLWGDRRGDLFRRHLADIQAFADDTEFLAFYDARREVYRQLVDATQALADLEDMTRWLEEQFPARPGPAEVHVSPLIGSHHWTSGTQQKALRIWIRPPSPGKKAPGPVERMSFARRLFTELDHPFVNPLTAERRDVLEVALAEPTDWATERAWSSYPSRELVFNEYMTWAVFLLYARDRLEPSSFAAIRTRTVLQMQMQRGFRRFADFAETLLELSEENGLPASEQVDEMLGWCEFQ